MIDLMAIAAIDRETEVTYIRRERDWAARAAAEGRFADSTKLLPVLPATVTGHAQGNGNGHGNGHHAQLPVHGGHHAAGATVPGTHE
jgi:hypothetical protein